MRLKPFIWFVHLRGLKLQTAVTHHVIHAYGLKQELSLRQDRNYQLITFLICNTDFRNVSSTRRKPTSVSSVALPAVHSLHRLSYPVSFFESCQNIKLTKIHNENFEHIPTQELFTKIFFDVITREALCNNRIVPRAAKYIKWKIMHLYCVCTRRLLRHRKCVFSS